MLGVFWKKIVLADISRMLKCQTLLEYQDAGPEPNFIVSEFPDLMPFPKGQLQHLPPEVVRKVVPHLII